METNVYDELNHIIKRATNICFFGGAGVSTNSGLLDFRSKDGLYNIKSKYGCSYEEMLSIDYFLKRPITFYKFYKEFMIKEGIKPNKAHYALTKFDKVYNNVSIVTQNIDGLHQAAGNKNVFELHGSVLRNYCVKCHAFYDEKFILESKEVPTCTECGGSVKPDVVLYEEGLDDDVIRGTIKAISQADTLIIGGTSLVVYPAAGLINYFRGKNLVLINKSTTSADSKANLVIHDSIGKILSEVVNNL